MDGIVKDEMVAADIDSTYGLHSLAMHVEHDRDEKDSVDGTHRMSCVCSGERDETRGRDGQGPANNTGAIMRGS